MTSNLDVLARLSGVGKRYGTVAALDGIDLALRTGTVTALLGANGAGKTTAIGILLGLLAADAGQVSLLGQAPQSLAARREVGVMLQSAQLPDALLVRELLALVRSSYPAPRSMDECIAMAGLEDVIDRRYGRLSGGQQRRVQFALAVCGRPKLLFLDEPTTGLDIDARQRIWQAIDALVAEGAGVLLTTHYLEEAEALARDVVVIDHGRVIARGSVDEIRSRVSQRRIRCRSRLDAAQVGAWPEVSSCRREGEVLEILAPSAEAVARRLLAADAALDGLEIARAGLAEAFLALTRQGQEEAA